ncbi:MAG: oxygen-independent coproporphyrinogen III oxidase [Lachnospiraceae bacterium]|nr:oxygen-independent coproporphyrinogen III oxidase [Candidatus Colinaster scatohippi]
MISIYIHIPFCIKKCAYCDFLSFPSNEDTIEKYIDCLCNEIEGSEATGEEVGTIFFGGGTPSILTVRQLNRVMDKIKERFNLNGNCEATLECNPGTVSEEKLSGFYKAGINRLSIGLQSANDNELKYLGRIHTFNQFLFTYNTARKVGFKNINIDLMSAVPGQTTDSFRDTLTSVVALNPEHLSVYSLIIEEGTRFYDIYGDSACRDSQFSDVVKLPDEDAERAMYYMTKEVLDRFGYHRYEISNYAKEGYECRHNKVYWTGGDYVSFGIGAASFYKGIRYNNISDVTEYMKIWDIEERLETEKNRPDFEWGICNKKTHVDIHELSINEKMEEYMFVGLRLVKGINITCFQKVFKKDIRDVYGKVIDRYIDMDLMKLNGEWLSLTEKGIDVSNVVLADFLL